MVDWQKVREAQQANIKLFDTLDYDETHGDFYDDRSCQRVKKQIEKLHGRDLEERLAILDLSCGTGNLLLKLQKLGLNVFGVDISSRCLRQCMSNAAGLGLHKPKLCLGAAERIPIRGNTFDLGLISGSLHHYHEVSIVLKEINRVLKPRGHLIILGEPLLSGTTKSNAITAWLRRVSGGRLKESPWPETEPHQGFDKTSMLAEAGEVGFEDVNIVMYRSVVLDLALKFSRYVAKSQRIRYVLAWLVDVLAKLERPLMPVSYLCLFALSGRKRASL